MGKRRTFPSVSPFHCSSLTTRSCSRLLSHPHANKKKTEKPVQEAVEQLVMLFSFETLNLISCRKAFFHGYHNSKKCTSQLEIFPEI